MRFVWKYNTGRSYNGHGFGWTPRVGDGQGGLACCRSWGRKELDTTERLNWSKFSMMKCIWPILWDLSHRKEIKRRQFKENFIPSKGKSICIGCEASFSIAPLRNGNSAWNQKMLMKELINKISSFSAKSLSFVISPSCYLCYIQASR